MGKPTKEPNQRTMDYIQEQKLIEEEATLTGVRRAGRVMSKSQERGQEASTPVGSAMVNRIIGQMEILLLEDLKKRAEGRATKGGSLLKPLRDLDTRLLCIAATRAALNQMSRPMTLATLARRIGEALEDEQRWHKWERLNKPQADAVRRRVNKGSGGRQRRNALAGFARRWEARVLDDAWSNHRLLGVGLRFIDYLVRLEVFETAKFAKRVPGKKQNAAHAVKLTAAAAEWAHDMAEFVAVLDRSPGPS